MSLKRNHLFGTTVLAGFIAMSAPAAVHAAPAAQDPEATELGEVVVTGSRIRRNDLTSASPLAVVSAETIDKKGFANVADALNQQPVAGVPITRKAISRASAWAAASSTSSIWAPTVRWCW